MSKDNTTQDTRTSKALDFGRAYKNLVIPIPELVGLCVESKAVLMDLLNLTDDSEDIEGIKFVNFTLSLCADFFGDALDGEAAGKTELKRTRDLMTFREHLKEIMSN